MLTDGESSSGQHCTAACCQFQAKDLRYLLWGKPAQEKGHLHTHQWEHIRRLGMPRRFQHSLPLLINSNKAPDVGLTEGPACCITSLEAGPARLQFITDIFSELLFLSLLLPSGLKLMGPPNRGPGGPKVKVTSHRALNWLSKDLDRDCAPAHHTHMTARLWRGL